MGLPGQGKRIRVTREEQPAVSPPEQEPVQVPEQEPVKVGA